MSFFAYVLARILMRKEGRTSNPNPNWRDPGTPPEWEKGKYVKDRPDYVPYTPPSTTPRDTSARGNINQYLGRTGTLGTNQTFNTTLKRRIL